MTRFSLPIAILATSVATSSFAAQGAAVHYRLTQIVPDTPASTVLASDLNERNQVVGSVQDSSGRDHAFAWSGGVLTNLAPRLDPASTGSRAVGSNDRGDVVGFFFDANGATANFLLRRDQVTRIDGLPGAIDTGVADVNDRRQIIGNAFFDDGSSRAFIWENGDVMQLPPLDGDTSATAVAFNEGGITLGSSAGTAKHVVIWEDAAAVDLNIPGAVPRDINDREQVTGTLQRHGFLWDHGKVVDLPTLGGAVITQAASLNDAGEIVGTSSLETGPRATLWEDTHVFDLNELIRSNDPLRTFVSLEDAASINDGGAIVATGRDSRFPNELRTYLLTPVR